MSILKKLLNKKTTSGVFAVILGTRLSGKSTLAGTLPGKSLMLQANLRETGSNSAVQLAGELGNHLDIITFKNLPELAAIFMDKDLLAYDNVYVDGISALTEMKYREPDVFKIASSKNPWPAFDAIKNAMIDFIELSKGFAEEHGKNVFLTLSTLEKFDTLGNLIDLTPELRGQATLSQIKSYAPTVLNIRTNTDEDGKLIRELVTKTEGVYSARIDTLLDDKNPGVVPADLSKIIILIKGGSNDK